MTTRLDHYRLLGRSGLRVSPFALGTMTFGVNQGWGTDAAEARRIFDCYAEHGGNSIDTANFYASGESERMLGELLQGRRNRFVVATKRSEEHTSELQSLMRISYAVFCLKKQKKRKRQSKTEKRRKEDNTQHTTE